MSDETQVIESDDPAEQAEETTPETAADADSEASPEGE